MAECFYCFEDRRLTRAHLFHSAMRAAMSVVDDNVYLSHSSAADRGVIRAVAYAGDMRQSHVTALCEECNSRWMGTIEFAAAQAFNQVVNRHSVPPPRELMALARWAVVCLTLSSKLYPIGVPRQHRRAIRAAAGMPEMFSTFFVWTGEQLRASQIDFYRAQGRDEDDEQAMWFSMLHAGVIVMIVASPDLCGRVARVLHDAGIHSVLGVIGETGIYVPERFEQVMGGEQLRGHQEVHDLAATILGRASADMVTAVNGVELLDLSGGVDHVDLDLSFDFSGRLRDFRTFRGSGSERGAN